MAIKYVSGQVFRYIGGRLEVQVTVVYDGKEICVDATRQNSNQQLKFLTKDTPEPVRQWVLDEINKNER